MSGSSPNRAESAGITDKNFPVVRAPSPDDPYRQLDELLALVDQLCPRWPERPLPADRGIYKL
jgi:hypothetical protein